MFNTFESILANLHFSISFHLVWIFQIYMYEAVYNVALVLFNPPFVLYDFITSVFLLCVILATLVIASYIKSLFWYFQSFLFPKQCIHDYTFASEKCSGCNDEFWYESSHFL